MLISPSKATFFPEYIPRAFIASTAEANQATNYEQVIPLLKKYGVSVVDGRDFFLARKASSTEPLFSKSGTHWTRYGACLMTAQLVEQIAKERKETLRAPKCDDVRIASVPEGEDRDLADLTNLWNKRVFYQPLAYPKADNRVKMPNDLHALIVGDSFSWGLLHIMNDQQLVKGYDFYYYFQTHYKPDYSSTPVADEPKDALKQTLADHNLVIVEANEAALGDMGFGFVGEAVGELQSKITPER